MSCELVTLALNSGVSRLAVLLKPKRKILAPAIFFAIAVAPAMAGGDEDYNLLQAAQQGNLKKFNLMVNLGGNPHAVDRDGNNAVMLAAYGGNREILRQLILRRVDVDKKGGSGFTPLGMAVLQGDSMIVGMLLKSGADCNAKNASGDTPLHIAVRKERKDLTQMLLHAGADSNIADAEGETPLILAARTGQDSLAELLIDNRAELNIRDRDDKTALFWAIFEGHERVATMLVEYGADYKFRTSGYTALHWAQATGSNAVVSKLRAAGATE